jgi:hypothetical protein
MSDLIYLLIVILFFLASYGLLLLCSRLMEK